MNDSYISLAELLVTFPPRPENPDWTWEDEERDILARKCLCCGQPGHYQLQLEAHMAKHGLDQGILLCADGRLDGHHRVTAARRLGIDVIPLETPEQNVERYLRDHGPIAWDDRKVGDAYSWEDWKLPPTHDDQDVDRGVDHTHEEDRQA